MKAQGAALGNEIYSGFQPQRRGPNDLLRPEEAARIDRVDFGPPFQASVSSVIQSPGRHFAASPLRFALG